MAIPQLPRNLAQLFQEHRQLIHLIIPTYNQLDAFLACITSIIATTPEDAYFITWLDDGSETLTDEFIEDIIGLAPRNIQYETFQHTGNLTYLWNYGLNMGHEFLDEDEEHYAALVNSDVIFSKDWYKPLIKAAEQYDLVAPITNASGSYDQQRITTYNPQYSPNDDLREINRVATELTTTHAGQTVEGRIGGYFLFAKWENWLKHTFNENHFFDPQYTLVGNEDEFQTRLLANGGTIATCLDSFIFHYRSLSRDLSTISPVLLDGMYRPSIEDAKLAYFNCVTTDHYDTPEATTKWDRVTPYFFETDTVREQRLIKIKASSRFAQDYEYSLWCDGNITPLINPLELARKYLTQSDIAFFPHPARCCLYQEARAVIELELDEKERVNEQMERYRTEGMPFAFGLPETGVILRRHTAAVQEFETIWSQEVERGSHRDQLSVSYALWKTGMKAFWLPDNIRTTKHFRRKNHGRLRLHIVWG